MDLLTLLFRLPFLPLTGVVRLAEIIRDQAEGELHSPASARRELEHLEHMLASGELSAEEAEEAQHRALNRVVAVSGRERPPAAGAPVPAGAGSGGNAPGQRRVVRKVR